MGSKEKYKLICDIKFICHVGHKGDPAEAMRKGFEKLIEGVNTLRQGGSTAANWRIEVWEEDEAT